MRLTFEQAWEGRARPGGLCPNCSSASVRPSRRTYQGIWASVLGVKPMKCGACKSYFAAAGHGPALRADVEIPDVPFKAADPSARPLPGSERPPPGPDSVQIARPRRSTPFTKGACPNCGSESVRPATPGPLESLVSRFNAKDLYRCLTCNASFRRTNLLKLSLMTATLLVLLALSTYAAVALFGRVHPGTTAPRIQNKPIPQAPPPVFR